MNTATNAQYFSSIQALKDLIQCPLCQKTIKFFQFRNHLENCHSSTINPYSQCYYCFGLYKFETDQKNTIQVRQHFQECLQKFRKSTLLRPSCVRYPNIIPASSKNVPNDSNPQNLQRFDGMPCVSSNKVLLDGRSNESHLFAKLEPLSSNDAPSACHEPHFYKSMAPVPLHETPLKERHLYENIDPSNACSSAFKELHLYESIDSPNTLESTPETHFYETIKPSNDSQGSDFLDDLAIISKEKDEKVKYFNILAHHIGMDDYMVSKDDKGHWHLKNCKYNCQCSTHIVNPEKYFILGRDTVLEIRGKGWHFQDTCVWARMMRGVENKFVYRMETECECAKRFSKCNDY